MARISYESKRFSTGSLDTIARANRICAEYATQGYDLTLRQLYYQFVSRGWIANKQTEYKRLGGIINDARMAGKMDWDYIVDRTRKLEKRSHWRDAKHVLHDAAAGFGIDRWSETYQQTRVEVWIEKDALVGVLEACCPSEDVAYFSCRGYTSQSEMWSASQRLGSYLRAGQSLVILHLGDHDPSGLDMTRDIRDRIRTFLCSDWARYLVKEGEIDPDNYDQEELYDRVKVDVLDRFKVERIALNMDQIEQYNPPPNPAKVTDPRGVSYVAKHGHSSWELDALEPTVLVQLIRDGIEEHRDFGGWEEAGELEEEHRELLTAASNRWDEVKELLS